MKSFLIILMLAIAVVGQTDADMIRQARAALKANKLGGIQVVMRNKEATLSGTVKSLKEKQKAENILKTIEGIRSITNSITVPIENIPGALDDCISKLIEYDLQDNDALSKYQVLRMSVKNGNVKLKVFPGQGPGYRSSISDSAIRSLQRGISPQAIFRSDKSVRLLVNFENQIRRTILGIRTVSWTADDRCAPGYSCSVSGVWLPESYFRPCFKYRRP